MKRTHVREHMRRQLLSEAVLKREGVRSNLPTEYRGIKLKYIIDSSGTFLIYRAGDAKTSPLGFAESNYDIYGKENGNSNSFKDALLDAMMNIDDKEQEKIARKYHLPQ